MRVLVAILLGVTALPAVAELPLTRLPGADVAMLLPVQDREGDLELARFVAEALETELGRSLQMASTDGLRDELRRLRLRDAGDIDPSNLRRLAGTFEVEWLFSATLHAAWETPDPQIVLSAWAHRVEDNNLAWAGFESVTGRSYARALGRGRVEVLKTLAGSAVRRLVNDFQESLDRGAGRPVRAPRDRGGFLLERLDTERLGTVAVLPFESVTDARPGESGELITALARATLHRNGATVLHPGRVNAILRRRGLYMRGELDPAGRAALRIGGGADHILTGTVETYLAPATFEPNPHVAFSARLIDVDTGRIVWIHGQERAGWDNAGFFERGKVFDAGSLAETMMQSLVTGFLYPPSR